MTKEEKIKEAWGELLPFKPKGGYSLIDGYSNELYHEVQDDIDYNFFDYDQVNINSGKIRPKSLKGIENNNGWIKIESEDDLPKEEKDYWVVDSDGEVFICFFDTDYKAFSGYFHYDQKGKITHYQSIEKPLKPLY